MKKLQQVVIAVVISLFTAIPISNFGQSTSDNNLTGTGKFLGYDGAQDLDFKTDDILRMQLMQTQSSTINGFGLTPLPLFAGPPLSKSPERGAQRSELLCASRPADWYNG